MTAKSEWESLREAKLNGELTREQAICYGLADENADMTAVDAGFEMRSDRWYAVAISGYEALMASGEYAE